MSNRPAPAASRQRLWQRSIPLWALLVCCLSGCQSLFYPLEAIPADRIPPEFLREPQADKRPIDFSLLRHVKPPNYILDVDDILGVFIEGILGNPEEAPPVTMPEPTSDLSPGIGFPIPIREDGTISLPLLDPLSVRGLTVSQVQELVEKRYREKQILVDPKVIVTLLRKRTYRVFVIRQDNTNFSDPRFGAIRGGTGVFDRSDLSSRGFVLQLPAYENDILNALSQTGGLPGVNAKAEVKVLRGNNLRTEERFRQLQEMYQDPNAGIDPTSMQAESTLTIPLRLHPGEIPNIRPEDVILQDGDVVMVESRESEVYYTAGYLGGGERPLPRDYDLDVLGAVSIAGYGIGANSVGGGGGLGGGVLNNITTLPPTQLVILRKLPGNRQLRIGVDLQQAATDPRSRLLIAPGDTLILRYKPEEEVMNFATGVFFTFGIRELFRN